MLSNYIQNSFNLMVIPYSTKITQIIVSQRNRCKPLAYYRNSGQARLYGSQSPRRLNTSKKFENGISFEIVSNVLRPCYRGEICKKKKTITGHFGSVFEENSGKDLTWLSRCTRFRKASFSQCFPLTLINRKAGVIKFLRLEECFRKAAFSWGLVSSWTVSRRRIKLRLQIFSG